MVVRRVEGRVLVDYEALWVHVGRRSPATIRKHCPTVGTDEETGLLLYDAEQSKAILAGIPIRKRGPKLKPT